MEVIRSSEVNRFHAGHQRGDVLGRSRQRFDPDHSFENLGRLGVLRGGRDNSRTVDQVDLTGERDVLPDLGNEAGKSLVSS